VRTLLAKKISTNQWFQRVDSGNKIESQFAEEVSSQFVIPINDIQVVVKTMNATEYQSAINNLALGAFDGLGVISASIITEVDTRSDMKTAATAANSVPELRAVILEILDRL